MFEHIFQKAGLTPTQAAILEYLYQKKEAKASQIAKKIRRSRAIVYKDLEELIAFRIVEKIDKQGQVSIFRANHPTYMEKLIEKKEDKIKKDRELFLDYLPDLISSYNLVNNKPGVKFYEGIEGIEYVLWDTLKTREEIYTITDPKAVRSDRALAEVNQRYVEERNKKGIKKKLLAPISAKDIFPEKKIDTREIRFLSDCNYRFCTAIQIYNNKISYQTITENNKIGVIIEDKSIYQMHRIIFKNLWEKAV